MKTAIVEISESHEECIYSQLSFLKDAGHEVTLLLHKKLENQITAYAHLADNISFFDFESVSPIQKLRMQWHLFTLLKKFDMLILNTAHSYSVIRNIAVLLRFVKTKCIGVLHNTQKLQSSQTQRIISKKVKHYFVLNDALLPTREISNTIKVQSFYPIFFPKYEKVPVYKQNQIWIGIPGRIDYKRRDYDFLINALEQASVLERVNFLILGKVDRTTPDGNRLIESIEKSGKLKNFKLFHSFIDNPDFHGYLSACDYIMPLLRPNQEYLGSKISGAFNLAFAHKKPMLCNSFFEAIPDLRENSLFYDKATFNQLLADIDNGNSHPPTSYSDSKWNYKFQQRRYIEFINE
ncbi:hypothetical protein LCGC14_1632690 [marine sediment metagenome]|uniref:Uncharacterized protein n=2 Tax=root TaxID=1 RepID=A0A831QPB0_9FLAO|nr:hypothetical protein [Pricia antarctica]